MNIESLINLPNIVVTDITRNEKGHLLITVEPTEPSTLCHVCKKEYGDKMQLNAPETHLAYDEEIQTRKKLMLCLILYDHH